MSPDFNNVFTLADLEHEAVAGVLLDSLSPWLFMVCSDEDVSLICYSLMLVSEKYAVFQGSLFRSAVEESFSSIWMPFYLLQWEVLSVKLHVTNSFTSPNNWMPAGILRGVPRPRISTCAWKYLVGV